MVYIELTELKLCKIVHFHAEILLNIVSSFVEIK